VSPKNCDACEQELNKPYRMPCNKHYIGECCRPRSSSEKKCPKCKFFSEDFNFQSLEPDWDAYENR